MTDYFFINALGGGSYIILFVPGRIWPVASHSRPAANKVLPLFLRLRLPLLLLLLPLALILTLPLLPQLLYFPNQYYDDFHLLKLL